jgi:hypothetical protein
LGVVDKLYEQLSYKKQLNAVREQLSERRREHQFKDGALVNDDARLFESSAGPRMDVAQIKDEILPYCTIDGMPVTVNEVIWDINDTHTKPCYPLVGGPNGPLSQFVVTRSWDAFVTAGVARYKSITRTDRRLAPNMDRALANLMDLTRFRPPMRPYDIDEVMEHGKGRWGKRKQNQYKEAFEFMLTGRQFPDSSAAVDGKSHETLTFKNLDVGGEIVSLYKGRNVFFGKPSLHVKECGVIQYSLGAKLWLIDTLNRLEFTVHGYPVRFFVPKTGKATELEQRCEDALNRGEILVLISGDDGQCRVASSWEIAVDLKSCDTTIQDLLQERIFRFLQHFGLPDNVRREIEEYNSCAKKFRFGYQKRKVLKQELPMPINCSGNSLTTVITLVASAFAWTEAFLSWNGAPETLSDTVEQAFQGLGLKAEFEAHLNTDPVTRLSPLGSTTFLSQSFITTVEGRVRAIPAHGIKNLVVKGQTQAGGDDQIGYALKARARIPALQTRPTLRRMAACFERLGSQAPIEWEEWLKREDPSWEYKVQYDNVECISMIDEANFLSNYGVTLDDVAEECTFWEHCSELPTGHVPPVTAKMAAFFY